jgi:DNA-binding MarR family transcriptional regulator
VGTNSEITDRITSVVRLLDKAGDIMFSRFGLTMGSYRILTYISLGIITTKELAKKIQSTPGNITHKTKILEEGGYIRRSVSAQDKRKWDFILTPNGEKALKNIQSLHEQALGQLYSQFSQKQKLRLKDFLDATEKHLEFVVQNDRLLLEWTDALIKSENWE